MDFQRIISFLLAILFASPLYAQEESVTLSTKIGDIKGTLLLPAEKSKDLTVVLIIAGSGPTDRNGNQPTLKNNAYRMLADSLAAGGIASLRYDKRGIGESISAGTSESELRFEHYVSDAREWISKLDSDKRFSRIIVAGHSEGALIGILASKENKAVDALISIAGPARPAAEMISQQIAAQPQEIQDLVNPRLDTLEMGIQLKAVPPILNSLFRPSVQPYMISWFRYDPRVEIARLNVPVYIVQGSTDIQVLERDAELLTKAYPKATKQIVTNMNHVLKEISSMDREAQIPTYSASDLPLHREFAQGMVAFIKSVK